MDRQRLAYIQDKENNMELGPISLEEVRLRREAAEKEVERWVAMEKKVMAACKLEHLESRAKVLEEQISKLCTELGRETKLSTPVYAITTASNADFCLQKLLHVRSSLLAMIAHSSLVSQFTALEQVDRRRLINTALGETVETIAVLEDMYRL